MTTIGDYVILGAMLGAVVGLILGPKTGWDNPPKIIWGWIPGGENAGIAIIFATLAGTIGGFLFGVSSYLFFHN
jgi:hypothetical protein